jgi:hypothetical protein
MTNNDSNHASVVVPVQAVQLYHVCLLHVWLCLYHCVRTGHALWPS